MKNILLLSISSIILCFLPAHLFSQVITLGNCQNFALFTSVGAITNTGISHVTGHVGSNVGGSTTFGNVNGNMHDQDTASATCAVDLLVAYGQLNAAVPTSFLATPFGNGATLLPGVYQLASAGTLTQTLTLDAQGNSSAVFIFQIQGSLSIDPNTKVKLINGAMACNVYWKVEGVVTMNTGTSMKGTVVANAGAIHILSGDTLEGRALVLNEAIDIHDAMIYTPVGCGSPVLMGPPLPNIGGLMCYTLFSAIGPVDNSGITNVTGDVGSNSASPTGFDTLLVLGKVHEVPDGSTAQAATDLLAAYNQMNAMVEDILLVYPAQFGQNLVLTPHTYLMNGAVTLTDTLYLNAMGEPDATFVIKCYGAFSALDNSRVILINGAQAKNVYWMVNGAVSILSNSIFNGSIICNSGAMDLTSGAQINGRALTTTGALTTLAITAIMPPGCGPEITSAILNDTVCLGDTARFVVSATGAGLTYKWRKGNVDLINDLHIQGVTNDTLIIFPTVFSDSASNYNVIVSGVGPDVTSNFATLFINAPPIIITEPLSQVTCLGGTTQFIANASGTDLVYQWRKGNVNLSNTVFISGVNNDTLTISSTSFADTASNYNVLVTGSCPGNDISNFVQLAVNTATLISVEPINQVVCAGSLARFSVVATGSGLTYQWRRGNTDLANSLNISGVDNDTLTIDPTAFGDTASDYNVLVSGLCGINDTSDFVQLSFNSATLISVEPINQVVCAGSLTRFSVVATGSGLTYQWRRGNTDLANSLTISGVDSNILTIDPTAFADTASDYNVVVSGLCGSDVISDFVQLSFSSGQVITVQPISQAICIGATMNFSVAATGSGLTYQWRRGNTDLANSLTISGVDSNILTIDPTAFADTASDYNVVVSGLCGSDVISDFVQLSFNSAPAITVQPISQAICRGDAVNLSVVATGSGLTYQWRKGITPLANAGHLSGVFTSLLSITLSDFIDTTSTYNVVVSGLCGPPAVSASVSLMVSDPLVVTVASNTPVCMDGSIELSTPLVAGATYSWTGPNGFVSISPTVTIANATAVEYGTYSVVVTNLGCPSLVASAVVESKDCSVSDFFIPEGFSPNGDGINDVFVIRGISIYPNNTINIYNRWGVKVYGISPYINAWDGTNTSGINIGGSALPVGSYFYTLDLGDGSKVIQGSIYLNR